MSNIKNNLNLILLGDEAFIINFLRKQMNQFPTDVRDTNILNSVNDILNFCYENQDNSNCQFIVSIIYFNGYGVEKDKKKSKEWLDKSLEQNNKFAQYEMGELYDGGFMHLTREEEYRLAIEWFHKSANQNCARAQCSLGFMIANYNNIDHKYDNRYEEALKWFQRSVDLGNDEAIFQIGKMYDRILSDYDNALEWYIKSYKNGHKHAINYIKALINNNIDIHISKYEENKKMKEEIKEMEKYITHLETRPYGPIYEEAEEHWNENIKE